MGAPMARNLLKAGHALAVWNRTAEKAQPLVGVGARLAHSPAEAVAGAELVISMVSDGTAGAALVGDAKVRAALGANVIWVDMSSAKPEEARWQNASLAELGVAHLDAPVSGGVAGAEAGTLAIMVGGAAETFERAAPVLQAMGHPTRVGPSGAGQLAKLANQAIVAVTIGAVAEAMLFLRETGADPAAVRAALKGGFADSTILQMHGARMTNGDFEPGGLAHLQLKDLRNALSEAQATGLTLPMVESVHDRFEHLCDEMDGGMKDHSALFLELCKQNQMDG